MHDLEKELSTFPVRTELKVQWGDMDAAQHVNNVAYLKWFETARVDYFTRLGQDVVFNDEKPGFILAKQNIKYIFPITYPDKVLVTVKAENIQEDRFDMLCHIYSLRHQRIAAIANGCIVTYDYQKGNKVNIPEDLKLRIINLEDLE